MYGPYVPEMVISDYMILIDIPAFVTVIKGDFDHHFILPQFSHEVEPSLGPASEYQGRHGLRVMRVRLVMLVFPN
jgi:uncharacterized membrane protein YgdD (TMEM256/DUF423 family)